VSENKKAGRNPPWTRDEIILALDFYRQLGGVWPRPNDPRVVALSQTLTTLGRSLGHSGTTLRNPNGVVMKLMNLRVHDPVYDENKSLKAGNRLEKEVWRDFADNPYELQSVAAAIRAEINKQSALRKTDFDGPENDYDGAEAAEGKLLTVLHHRRERSPTLAKRKKDAALRLTGKLACEACNFDFEEVYGERGRGFIECHHTRPLADLEHEITTKLADLALLCANCHRMIHAKRPWLSVTELRQLRT